MKVLMTTDVVGGVWTYALELIRGLAPYDVQFALATQGRPLSHDQRQDVEQLSNVDVFESSYRLEWMDDPWDDVREAGSWLLRLRDQVQPDLIHLNDYSHGCLPWGMPVLMVGHSCVCSWLRHVRGCAPDHTWDEYRRRVEQGIRAADLVVAPTQQMLSELENHYGPIKNTEVIYNGISSRAVRHVPREPFIFTAGRLWDEGKNIKLLAEIADRLDWPIHVAGTVDHPQGCGRVAWDNVQMLGRLSYRQVNDLMAKASLYALPAKYEPFGLTPLEAALNGCPLVLGDIGSLQEVWGDAAVYASPDSPSEWIHHLNLLIHNPPLRDRLARKSQRRASRYTLPRMADAYHNAYCELCSGDPLETTPQSLDRLWSNLLANISPEETSSSA